MKKFLVFALFFVFAAGLYAQTADDITGIWWNEQKTSKIKVELKDGKYIGTSVYIIPEKYINGQPELDHENPDPKLKTRSRLNLQVLSGLVYNSTDKEWAGGQIYDPANGKTYDCYAWLEDKNTLQIKGFIAGVRMLGRKTTWTRTTL